MRKILITGASGDLGLNLIEHLIKDDVIIGAQYFSHAQKLRELQKKYSKQRLHLFKADLSIDSACHKLVNDFVKWAGSIDGLVQLSGGISKRLYWGNMTQEIWNKDLALNLTGPFFLAQAASALMKDKGGKIILTSTASASHGGGPNTLSYGVAKAGVECFVKRLAKDLGQFHINVNCVAAGFILTDKRRNEPADMIEQRIQSIPLQKPGFPDDVSNIIEYLLSTKSDFISGEVFTVSGGEWLNVLRW